MKGKYYSTVMMLASLLAFSALGFFWAFHNHMDEIEDNGGVMKGSSPRKEAIQTGHGEEGVAALDLSNFHRHIQQAEQASQRYTTTKEASRGQEMSAKVNRKIQTADLSARTQPIKPNTANYRQQEFMRSSSVAHGLKHGQNDHTVGTRATTTATVQEERAGAEMSPNEVTKRGKKKDVIIGMAYDIDAKNLAVFCGSVRDPEVCPDAAQTEVLIFAKEPVSSLYTTIAKKYSITLVPFNLEKDFGVAFHAYHPSSLRWALIHDYLEKNDRASQYNKVWLADARDTWFQRDPFAMLPTGKKAFYAFKGVEGLGIKNCGWNGGWVKDCFGQTELTDIGDNDIICSGVSVGDIETVMLYLSMMSKIISGDTRGHQSSPTGAGTGSDIYMQKIAKRAKFPSCERNGVDQGVHNVLVHETVVPHLTIHDHQTGLVSNLQAKKSSVTLSANAMKTRSIVKNGMNVPVAVAHQYDRRYELQQTLFEKYVDWIKVGDLAAEWAFESACAGYTYEINRDYFKKRCDLKMKGGATSAASCCKACKDVNSCSAFTYYSSVCFLKTCNGPMAQGGRRDSALLQDAVSAWRKG